jgi:hypothetical protein
VAARPGRGPARREGMRAQLAPERTRERGATALHLAEDADLDHERMLTRYDAVMEYALEALEQTFVETDGDWAERMYAAIGQLLGLAAANSREAHLCTVGIFEAGGRGLERRDRSMARFMRLCEAGYSQAGVPIPSRLMPQVAAGAVFELIRSHAADGRLDDLMDALPTAALIVLAPIVGRDEALRVAGAGGVGG